MLTFEIEILGPMTVMGWILLAVGLVLTAVMVRRSLLVGFAALCLGAVFLIEMFVIAPTTWFEMQVWGAGLGQLGFFSLLPAGLILMALDVKGRRVHRVTDAGTESLSSA